MNDIREFSTNFVLRSHNQSFKLLDVKIIAIIPQHLRLMESLGRFGVLLFSKGENIVILCLLSHAPSGSLDDIYSKRKAFACKGSRKEAKEF